MGFNSQPQANGFPIASASLPNAVQSWIDFNITYLVNKWVDGTSPNYGVRLFFEEGYGNKLSCFVSSDNLIESQRPKLTLTIRD